MLSASIPKFNKMKYFRLQWYDEILLLSKYCSLTAL